MNRDIFWHLNQIPLCLLWIYYYHNMLAKTRGGGLKTDLIRISVTVIIQTIIGIIIAHLFPEENFLRLIINSFVIVGLLILIGQGDIKESIFCYVIHMAISIVAEVFAMLGSLLISQTPDGFSLGPAFYIINDILCLIGFIIAVKVKNRRTISERNHLFEIIILLVLNQFLWVYWISYYIVLNNNPNIILTFLVILIQIMSFIFIYIFIKDYLKVTKQQIKIAIKKDNEEKLQSLIGTLSDKQNVINNIYRQIQEENIEMIELNKMTDDLMSIKNRIYCDNPSVNALLSYFYDSYAKTSIQYTVNIYCSLNNNIDDFEFNTLLSNILKNSFESCDKYVSVEIDCKNDILVIKCQNDCVDKKKTTKVIRGNGIHIIRGIVERYNGSYNFFIDNNIATSICMMNIN